MLTGNEKKVLRLLISSFDTDYSINEVAKQCGLAPNGAFKILKKLEKEGILKSKKIANIISYKIDFENEKTMNVLELALITDVKGRVKYRYDDLIALKGVAKACVLFGSHIDLKKEPNDLDALFILKKDEYREYRKKLMDVKSTLPVRLHDAVQTEEDLKKNIIGKDKVIIDILRNGIVLWGCSAISEAIKDVNRG